MVRTVSITCNFQLIKLTTEYLLQSWIKHIILYSHIFKWIILNAQTLRTGALHLIQYFIHWHYIQNATMTIFISKFYMWCALLVQMVYLWNLHYFVLFLFFCNDIHALQGIGMKCITTYSLHYQPLETCFQVLECYMPQCLHSPKKPLKI